MGDSLVRTGPGCGPITPVVHLRRVNRPTIQIGSATKNHQHEIDERVENDANSIPKIPEEKREQQHQQLHVVVDVPETTIVTTSSTIPASPTPSKSVNKPPFIPVDLHDKELKFPVQEASETTTTSTTSTTSQLEVVRVRTPSTTTTATQSTVDENCLFYLEDGVAQSSSILIFESSSSILGDGFSSSTSGDVVYQTTEPIFTVDVNVEEPEVATTTEATASLEDQEEQLEMLLNYAEEQSLKKEKERKINELVEEFKQVEEFGEPACIVCLS